MDNSNDKQTTHLGCKVMTEVEYRGEVLWHHITLEMPRIDDPQRVKDIRIERFSPGKLWAGR